MPAYLMTRNGGAKRRQEPETTAVDVHVGARVRHRRILLGLSQGQLAEGLGLTFQQVQKYEKGANRIGAGRLYDVARRLDVPVGYFYEGLDQPDLPVPRRLHLELFRALDGCPEDLQHAVLQLVRALPEGDRREAGP